jgi:hypothetical protein
VLVGRKGKNIARRAENFSPRPARPKAGDRRFSSTRRLGDGRFPRGCALFDGLPLPALGLALTPLRPGLERFPAEWNHSVEKKSLQIQKLEHILIAQIDST